MEISTYPIYRITTTKTPIQLLISRVRLHKQYVNPRSGDEESQKEHDMLRRLIESLQTFLRRADRIRYYHIACIAAFLSASISITFISLKGIRYSADTYTYLRWTQSLVEGSFDRNAFDHLSLGAPAFYTFFLWIFSANIKLVGERWETSFAFINIFCQVGTVYLTTKLVLDL